jgi:hypothetical protein
MIKSVGSVFENNVVADSTMGDIFMITPYLEPAANMVFSRNVFVNLSTTGIPGSWSPPPPAGQPIPPPSTSNTLQVSIDPGMRNATLANSGMGCGGPSPYHSPACPFMNGYPCHCAKWGGYDYGKPCEAAQDPKVGHFPGYGFEKGSPPDFPELASTDPVLKEMDYNAYFGVQGHQLSGLNGSLHDKGWDLHAIDSDPQITRSKVAAWNRSCSDYVPRSPLYDSIGFRSIDAENIGLLPSFRWGVGEIMRVDATRGRKLQAERYTRMHGLWRSGSAWVGGAEGACKNCHYTFSSQAWARYDHVHADCTGECVVQLRFKSAAKPDAFSPKGNARHISVTMGAPASASEAVVIAATPGPVSSAGWSLLNLTIASAQHSTITDQTIFLNLDGECFVDWLRFVPA